MPTASSRITGAVDARSNNYLPAAQNDGADTVAPFDRRAERLRPLDEIVDDLLAKLTVGEHRPSALRRRQPETQRDRIEVDAHQLLSTPLRPRHDRLPHFAIRRIATCVVGEPCGVEIAYMTVLAEIVRRVRL